MESREKDPSTALLIEIAGGLFGFLGLGHIYVGRTNEGIVRLIIFLVYNIIAWIAIYLLFYLVFVGCVCVPFQLAIQIGVPIWSGLGLKRDLEGVQL